MQERLTPSHSVALLGEVIVDLVRRDEPVLTSHQLGVYLTCYLCEGDHTVRGLANDLNVSKSVITRALDKLTDLDLARRRIDPADRRSILVERTKKGYDLLEYMSNIAIKVGAELDGCQSGFRQAD